MTTPVYEAVSRLLAELIDGSAEEAAWVLNPGDPGLLRSLGTLSADDASAAPARGGASIAAHADHLRYGLHLLNQWGDGEDPFAAADYSASWRRVRVTDEEWKALRGELRAEAHQWMSFARRQGHTDGVDLTGVIASVAHLAYHLGAIRQLNRATRGPLALD